MRPFRNLIWSIPLSRDPIEHRAFIVGALKLPQDDPDVQSALREARARLARIANAPPMPAQTADPRRLVPPARNSVAVADPNDEADDEDERDHYLIELGPPAGVPLEQHLEWIRHLKAMPQDHREVRDALRRAYETMERSERFRANEERRLRALPSLRS